MVAPRAAWRGQKLVFTSHESLPKGLPKELVRWLCITSMGFNSFMDADAASKTKLNPSQQITQIQLKMAPYRCRCTKCLESRIQMPSDAFPNSKQIPQMQAQIAFWWQTKVNRPPKHAPKCFAGPPWLDWGGKWPCGAWWRPFWLYDFKQMLQM